MTDTKDERKEATMSNDLKARLRQPVKAQDLMDPKTGRPMDNADAADALDARDERIAELERTAEMYLEGWYKDRRRALTDQPAQDGRGGFHEARPFPHPDSAEAKRRAAKPDQPADAGEPEHRATLAVVPDAYYGWNVTKDSQFLSGPHRSQADAVEAMRKYARADI